MKNVYLRPPPLRLIGLIAMVVRMITILFELLSGVLPPIVTENYYDWTMESYYNWKRGDLCNSNWNGFYVEKHWWNYAEGDRNLLGILSPELTRLSYMEILDFMWNNIGGSIPKEIGDILL